MFEFTFKALKLFKAKQQPLKCSTEEKFASDLFTFLPCYLSLALSLSLLSLYPDYYSTNLARLLFYSPPISYSLFLSLSLSLLMTTVGQAGKQADRQVVIA